MKRKSRPSKKSLQVCTAFALSALLAVGLVPTQGFAEAIESAQADESAQVVAVSEEATGIAESESDAATGSEATSESAITSGSEDAAAEGESSDNAKSDDEVGILVNNPAEDYINEVSSEEGDDNRPEPTNEVGDTTVVHGHVLKRINNNVSVGTVHDANEGACLTAQSSLPSSYNSVAKGHVTPVRDQTYFGTCWAFSTLSALESSMLTKGPSAGYNKNNLDLSERHLAYFTFGGAPSDPLHNTDGDKSFPEDTGYWDAFEYKNTYLNNGADNFSAGITLYGWTGAVDESTAPYSTLNSKYVQYKNAYDRTYNTSYFDQFLSDTNLPASLSRNDVVHLKDARYINMCDADEVKRAIVDYGAVGSTVLYHDGFESSSNGTHYLYNDSYEFGNHAITIVGWDDNVSRYEFDGAYAWQYPSSDGAWLCKNSWGTKNYGDGYFWLSYEDAYVNSGRDVAYAYEAETTNVYDNLYQYDGTTCTYSNSVDSGGSIANVFTAKANAKGELLKAVSFMSLDTNVDYSIQVYLNPKNANDPTSGTAALSSPLKGKMKYAGIHKLDLTNPVALPKGTKYAVVANLSHADGTPVYYSVDATIGEEYYAGYTTVNHSEAGQNYIKLSSNSGWFDSYKADPDLSLCPRIKAYTKNVDLSKYNVSKGQVTGVGKATYTGKAVCPNPTVKLNGSTLKKGTDYTVSYKNNVNAGTASVVITGKGCYIGSKTVSFTIARAKVSTPKATNRTYNGGTQRGVSAGTGYTLSGNATGNKAGTYTAVAKVDKNHCWSNGSTAAKKIKWKIAKASLKKAKVGKVSKQKYNGKAKKPSPKVKVGGKTLKKDRDYTITYKNNKKPGTATLIIKGKGSCTGSKTVKFKIVK